MFNIIVAGFCWWVIFGLDFVMLEGFVGEDVDNDLSVIA
jgi:hypothetical protein